MIFFIALWPLSIPMQSFKIFHELNFIRDGIRATLHRGGGA